VAVSTPAAEPRSSFWRRHPEVRARIEFTFHVASDGTVDDVSVVPGDHHPDFARETTEAVRRWTFRPTQCPEGARMRSRMVFVAPAWEEGA